MGDDGFGMVLSDAHAHLSAGRAREELAHRRERGILTCFSAGTPAEWEQVAELLAESGSMAETSFCVSFGIHPWKAGTHEVRADSAAFRTCTAIGEIGLDSAWCDVPLARQRAVFEAQLQIAADLHKPIVLHTKGQEATIAAMVEDFPEAVLVHWYSGPLDAFERFAEQDRFFTLGPDCTAPTELNHVLLTAPALDRVLIETDGLEGILWATDRDPNSAFDLALIESTLTNSTNAFARSRNLSPTNAARQLRSNMKAFYDLN